MRAQMTWPNRQIHSLLVLSALTTVWLATVLTSATHAHAAPVEADGDDTRGFVPEPRGRGTMSIVISCLSTCTICLWTAIHPDLEDMSFWARFMRFGVYAFIPEAMVFEAGRDFFHVRGRIKDGRRLARNRVGKAVDCSMTQGYLIHMRALAIKFYDGEETADGMSSNIPSVLGLVAYGHLDLPSDDEIADRSKSDGLSKALACFQIIWWAVQCGARAAQELPLTLLELETSAYVLFAILTFAGYWSKPRNVTVPICVPLISKRHTTRSEQDAEIRSIYDATSPRTYNPPKNSLSQKMMISTIVMGLAYGGWHCLPWDWAFPSDTEKYLWRSASVAILLAIIVLLIKYFLLPYMHIFVDFDNSYTEIACGVLYVIARAIICDHPGRMFHQPAPSAGVGFRNCLVDGVYPAYLPPLLRRSGALHIRWTSGPGGEVEG